MIAWFCLGIQYVLFIKYFIWYGGAVTHILKAWDNIYLSILSFMDSEIIQKYFNVTCVKYARIRIFSDPYFSG